MFQASSENQSQLSQYTNADELQAKQNSRSNFKSNESKQVNSHLYNGGTNKYGSNFHKKKASIDSFDEIDTIEANVPIADEDEQNFINIQDSSENRHLKKSDTQYRINLPKVNKKGIQIVISKDQTSQMVGNIQKLNHKFSNKTVKLESILPNQSQSISKRNFERNLKNANEEIQRLRRELNEKNKLLENLSQVDLSTRRIPDGVQSVATTREPNHLGEREINSQLMNREFQLSGLEVHTERKKSESTFRVRKLKLHRANTDSQGHDLSRANSQPVLLSRRQVNFNKDLQADHEMQTQPLDLLNHNTNYPSSLSMEFQSRLSSASQIVNVQQQNSTRNQNPFSSNQQTPSSHHNAAYSSSNLNNNSNYSVSYSLNDTLNDPRSRKYKTTQKFQNSRPQESPQNLSSIKLPSINTQNIIKQSNLNPNPQLGSLKTVDLDVLEERDEQEEDGDKLTREGFYKSGSTLDSGTLQKIKKNNNQNRKLANSSSNQALLSSQNQMKSTALTLNKQQSGDWNMTQTQSKYNSINTPNNRNSQLQIAKNNSLNQTNQSTPKMNLNLQKQAKSQTEKNVKPILKNRNQLKVQLNQNNQILDQDEDRLLNPVNDEMSPIQSFDPGFDDEPDIPLRGQQVPGTYHANGKDPVKSSYELLQDLQKKESRGTGNTNKQIKLEESPSFANSNIMNDSLEEVKENKHQQAQILASILQQQNDFALNVKMLQENVQIMPTQQLKEGQGTPVKPLLKRLEIFYEDDVDDDYINEFQSPDQNEKDENADISIDHSDDVTPLIFTETLYQQSSNNIFVAQKQKQEDLINPFVLSDSGNQFQESMDFGSTGKDLSNAGVLNIRSSAMAVDRSNNLRASAVRYSQLESQLKNYYTGNQHRLTNIEEEDELCRYQNSSFSLAYGGRSSQSIIAPSIKNADDQNGAIKFPEISKQKHQLLQNTPSMQAAVSGNNIMNRQQNQLQQQQKQQNAATMNQFSQKVQKPIQKDSQVNLSFNQENEDNYKH
ncbi:UNKNOWN [Stylonychia lemnae]|uniref:Uncharacterized protein n=1 Tax=Stylonychia lemnae TaxID=5949 RepID=A0A078AKW5_STYLE|nr:UNKNOWN [Stylonychia lemnae]|eukprot:CDW82526.1 UNKNOWN [Stylonychia lemnae]